jgi:ribosomal protein S18 acetylase RimI-like enzyme
MNIEMIIMEVYSKNKIAQNLYKKMGFLKVGTIPNAIKQRSGYMDDIIMYKVLKK